MMHNDSVTIKKCVWFGVMSPTYIGKSKSKNSSRGGYPISNLRQSLKRHTVVGVADIWHPLDNLSKKHCMEFCDCLRN